MTEDLSKINTSNFYSINNFCFKNNVVYNLLNGVDIEATETQIDLYQTENMQSIRERLSHIAEEERRIEMLIKHEQQAAAALALEIQVRKKDNYYQKYLRLFTK